MEELSGERLSGYVDMAVGMVMQYGPKLLLAIIVLLIGLWIINRSVRVFGRSMEARNVEPTLAKFLQNFASILFKALLIISVVSMIGVATTSFIAVLGAAGLAVGLALQGSLANFAGGVLILLFRPYRAGDYIDAQGVSGTVSDIQIFNTIMRTPDNKVIIIPNGPISNGIITNYSTEPTRRVDWVFRIGYGDDIDKSREVLERCIAADDRVLSEPEHEVLVSSLDDTSVNITVRAWANAADYWGLFFDMLERVKRNFDDAGITIPYPQRHVHLHRHDSSSAVESVP